MQSTFDELRLTGRLPSPSAVGLRILELTQDDDYLQEDLTDTIASDPSLAGRILRLANVADRDGLEGVATVPQAAMRLGAQSIRNIALGFTLLSDNRSGSCEGFDIEGFWAESMAIAVAAQVLAQQHKIYEPTEAFTCGLLCSIGKLAFASVHPDAYGKILTQYPGCSERELAELESGRFQISNREVTAAMMEEWGLPLAYREAVLTADDDEQALRDDSGRSWALVSLLRAGRVIARVLNYDPGEGDDEWRRRFFALHKTASGLGMGIEQLFSTCDEIQDVWASWGALLKIEVPAKKSLVELAASMERRSARQQRRDRRAPAESTLSLGIIGAAPTRILLVDDDSRMLRLIEHHLSREGFEIITASSSDEGLRLALEKAPQIVVTDWEMPGMTGVKLCQTLRQTEAGRKMYIVIVTARENDEQVVEGFAFGADDYVVKPFNPRILLARVRAGQRMIRMREQVEESERVRLRQVAELGILTRKLRAAAMTDALTELPNRRYAMNRLKQEWESAVRTGRPLSVIMCDIDHFKRVNDVFGHDIGDVVLKETAQALRSQTRGGDVLCRLGGEEFLSINIGCDIDRALVCAERLRTAVEMHAPHIEGFPWNVTMSLGVAEWTPDSMAGVDDLLKESDQALYGAKEGGRNRVVVSSGVESRARRA